MVNQRGSNEQLRELALFAGAGGGIIGGHMLGWRTICAVECERYPASVLCARQNDKILPPFPIWDDVCTFDGKPWRGIVDVVSGGFPCQDISAAGGGGGITGLRSGLWKEMARIVGEVRPRYVFVENSPMLTTRGLGTVLGDLAALGFDAEWGVLSAADVGAPHLRERIWIVGHSNHNGQVTTKVSGSTSQGSDSGATRPQQTGKLERSSEQYAELADAMRDRLQGSRQEQHLCNAPSAGFSQRADKPPGRPEQIAELERSDWWATEPNVGRVVTGMAARVDRLKSIGNGQVPLCAATAFRLLHERIKTQI